MIAILNAENRRIGQNATKGTIKTNKWPLFEGETSYATENTGITKFPWELSKTSKNTYPRNFAYHRVTGKPFNKDKNPKAYIAVSVIAPKPINMRTKAEDVSLENELRELKPWTHSQNLKNMEAIRSRWVIQSEENRKKFAP